MQQWVKQLTTKTKFKSYRMILVTDITVIPDAEKKIV